MYGLYSVYPARKTISKRGYVTYAEPMDTRVPKVAGKVK